MGRYGMDDCGFTAIGEIISLKCMRQQIWRDAIGEAFELPSLYLVGLRNVVSEQQCGEMG